MDAIRLHLALPLIAAILGSGCDASFHSDSTTTISFYLSQADSNSGALCVKRHGREPWPMRDSDGGQWLSVEGSSTIDYCHLSADGTIRAWVSTPNARATHRLVIAGDMVQFETNLSAFVAAYGEKVEAAGR